MHFREVTVKLSQKLKEDDKAAYGVIKSLLSMDSNADVYDRTDSLFFLRVKACGNICWKILKKAEKFIFLEYYIVEEGLMWNSILDILEQKAAQGCRDQDAL